MHYTVYVEHTWVNHMLDNPVNWVLAAIVAGLTLAILSPKKQEKLQHQPVLELQTWTVEELAKFNGITDPKIYICIKQRVFDVTASKSFYGPGSSYEIFAGRDASRGLAKNSFDPNVLSPNLDDLTSSEREALDGWEQFFVNKYQHVGYLADS